MEKYTATLEDLMRDDDLTYMKGELYNPGGYGRRVAETLSWMVKENPVDGISTNFQLFIVRMGGIKLWNPTGMPKLAHNLDELRNMLDGRMDAEALMANG